MTSSLIAYFSVEWYAAVTLDLKWRDQNRIAFSSIVRLSVLNDNKYFLVLYKTNNESFSFVWWHIYFHSVKDEMFYSTWLRLLEWVGIIHSKSNYDLVYTNTCSLCTDTHVNDWLIHYSAFFDIQSHVALGRNPGPGYNKPLSRLTLGDL